MHGSTRAHIFMATNRQDKLDYAEIPGQRPRYDGYAMIHLLLQYTPYFLELDEIWVEKLINAEMHLLGKANSPSLIYLFQSKKLNNFNFKNTHFQKLLKA